VIPRISGDDLVGEARKYARKRDWQSLWWLILSQPLPRAARAAAYLKRRKWYPRSEADARVADILTGIDGKDAMRVGDQIFDRTARILPSMLTAIDPVGFAVRHPVAALSLHRRDPHTSTIVTVDRTGVRETLYEGPAVHWSLCALDAETVIARREFENGGYRGDTEIVQYTPGGESVLANGFGLLDAVVDATATGFVIGTKLAGVAIAVADGEQVALDLREHGLRRADQFAVDATGNRIAFVDGNRMLITDSRLQPQHEIAVQALPHGEFSAITFTEDSIVTSGRDRGLYRWQIIGDRIRGLHSEMGSRPARQYFRLLPVPQWNLLVAEGGNANFHYDIATLESAPAPAFLCPAGPHDDKDLSAVHAIGTFEASAHGWLAVYVGGLATFTYRSVTHFYSTIVQDLEHPLNILAKPLRALDAADADRVRTYLKPSPGGEDVYPLTATERAMLEAAVEVCAWAPRLQGA